MHRTILVCGTSFNVFDTGTGFWNNIENGIWELDTLWAIKSVIGPRTLFFDVGAWIGPITLFAASCGADVIAYEPDEVAFREMQNNISENKDASFAISLINAAIGSEPGELKLYTRQAGNSETSVFQTHERFGETITCSEINVVPMLDIRNELALRFDPTRHDNLIVKIDVEGAEFLFFPTVAPYLQSVGATILLSTHPMNINTDIPSQTALRRAEAKLAIVSAAEPFDWYGAADQSVHRVDKADLIARSLSNLGEADTYILRSPPRMRVYVDNGPAEISKDPILGFPFSHLPEAVAVESPDQADFVFAYFPCPYTLEVNETARKIRESDLYKQFRHKYVWQSLCDFPDFARADVAGHKFVLSPPPARNLNLLYNVHPMPIHPCAGDYRIQMDRAWSDQCRGKAKIHDFVFIGSVDEFPTQGGFFGGRAWLRQLEQQGLPNFYLRSGKGWAFAQDWERDHREWMERVAAASYGFTPADSSNSPRLFWTMQVGTIPILTDYEHLPFDDVIDWEELAVIVPSYEKLTFDYRSLPTSGPKFEAKRKAVIAFWEKYCYYPNAARELINRIPCGPRYG